VPRARQIKLVFAVALVLAVAATDTRRNVSSLALASGASIAGIKAKAAQAASAARRRPR
jgi:hypothetical protein